MEQVKSRAAVVLVIRDAAGPAEDCAPAAAAAIAAAPAEDLVGQVDCCNC
jgi:hypothetical protein